MTFAEVKSRSDANRNAELRAKWQVLREATLALRPYRGTAESALQGSEIYAAYLQASREYEEALKA